MPDKLCEAVTTYAQDGGCAGVPTYDIDVFGGAVHGFWTARYPPQTDPTERHQAVWGRTISTRGQCTQHCLIMGGPYAFHALQPSRWRSGAVRHEG
jgi:hypothetical protein